MVAADLGRDLEVSQAEGSVIAGEFPSGSRSRLGEPSGLDQSHAATVGAESPLAQALDEILEAASAAMDEDDPLAPLPPRTEPLLTQTPRGPCKRIWRLLMFGKRGD